MKCGIVLKQILMLEGKNIVLILILPSNTGKMASLSNLSWNWGANGYKDKDGLVIPSMRQVSSVNVTDSGLNKLQYDKTGKANLGSITNYYYTPTSTSRPVIKIK